MPFTKQTPRNFFVSPVEIEETEPNPIDRCDWCCIEGKTHTMFDKTEGKEIELCESCVGVLRDSELNIN